MTKDNIKSNGSEPGTQGAQAVLIGEDFKPSAEANMEIERLLDFESDVYGGDAHRKTEGPLGVMWVKSPDYCNGDALTLEILEERGVSVFVLKVEEAKKGKKVLDLVGDEFIAVFDLDDVLYATVPFALEEEASACALWFILSQ